MSLNVLLVEDDEAEASAIEVGLRDFGYSVLRATTADAVPEAARLASFDAIILDRMLTDGDCVMSVRSWRAAGFDLPILMLTSMSGVASRVSGLDAGADDYVAKPCEPRELDARLRALVRRVQPSSTSVAYQVVCGSVRIDRVRRETWRADRRILLQPREQKVLEELAIHCGQVVSREALLSAVWNLSFDPRTKLIETQISRLREKLNAGFRGDPIETVRGAGYRLRCDV